MSERGIYIIGTGDKRFKIDCSIYNTFHGPEACYGVYVLDEYNPLKEERILSGTMKWPWGMIKLKRGLKKYIR